MTDRETKKPLRICLVGPAYPYRGGISHYNSLLAKHLCRLHDVYSVNFKRLYPDFLFPGKTQYDESSRPLAVDSVRIIDSVNPFTWARAGFHILSKKFDVVIFQWWHPFFAPAYFKICSILRMFSRAKIIFICHNVLPHESSVLDRLLLSLAFLLPHAFLVQSLEDRENLLGMRREATVSVHPLPIFDFFNTGSVSRDEARKKVGIDEGVPLILFFGYIRPYKGLKFLLEAMPVVVNEVGAKLLVVGEFYEEREPYIELVEKLGISANVRFVDYYVPNEEVESYFVASDLVVLPYLSATQSGIVQVAMAFDRPVVVTRVGGLPDVVSEGKTGFIVPPGDSGAISDIIVRFFRERLYNGMKDFFPEEKKRFSWNSMISTLEDLIAGVRR